MSMLGEGARTWLVPDAYLPPAGPGPLVGHESLCLLNAGEATAHVRLDFYFEDRPPIKDVAVELGGERAWHLRLDKPENLGGVQLPRETCYAIRVRSDVPIVVQHSRMDVTQPNLALFTTMGWPAPSDR